MLYNIFQQYDYDDFIFSYTTTRYIFDNIRQSFKHKIVKHGYKEGLHTLRRLLFFSIFIFKDKTGHR